MSDSFRTPNHMCYISVPKIVWILNVNCGNACVFHIVENFKYSYFSVYRSKRSHKFITVVSCVAPHRLKLAHCET